MAGEAGGDAHQVAMRRRYVAMKMAMKIVTQNSHSLLGSSFLFLDFFIFGRFDTSGSMIALSALDEQHEHEQYVEELGILVVGCLLLFFISKQNRAISNCICAGVVNARFVNKAECASPVFPLFGLLATRSSNRFSE